MENSAVAPTGHTMQDDPSRRPSTVVHLQGADTRLVADAALSTWRQIEDTLSPIIGQRGVIALFRRSQHLTSATCAWLPNGASDTQPLTDLHAALSQQAPAEARAAQAALLQNFIDVLSKLIGAALTDRLLQPVLEPSSSGDAAQDTTP
jgi:hypothetical protein